MTIKCMEDTPFEKLLELRGIHKMYCPGSLLRMKRGVNTHLLSRKAERWDTFEGIKPLDGKMLAAAEGEILFVVSVETAMECSGNAQVLQLITPREKMCQYVC